MVCPRATINRPTVARDLCVDVKISIQADALTVRVTLTDMQLKIDNN